MVTANRWQVLALLYFQRLLEYVTKKAWVPIESTEDEVCRAVCSDKTKKTQQLYLYKLDSKLEGNCGAAVDLFSVIQC